PTSDLHSFPTRRSSDLVVAHLNDGKAVVSTAAGGSALRDVGLSIGERHGGLRHHSSRRISHQTRKACGIHLCGQVRPAQQDGKKDRKSTRLNSSHRTIS